MPDDLWSVISINNTGELVSALKHIAQSIRQKDASMTHAAKSKAPGHWYLLNEQESLAGLLEVAERAELLSGWSRSLPKPTALPDAYFKAFGALVERQYRSMATTPPAAVGSWGAQRYAWGIDLLADGLWKQSSSGRRGRVALKKKPGRKAVYDAKRDAKLYQDFQSSGVASIKEFARMRGLSYAETDAALKRVRAHRSRNK